MGQVHLFDDAAQIGESTAVVRAQDALVGDAQAIQDIHHVIPAFQGKERVAERKRLRLLGSFFPIAVKGLVKVGNGFSLAKRLHQKGVVGPAGTGDFLKADAVFPEEVGSINGRPDGRMMGQQVRGVADSERLRGWMDAVAVAAVQLFLLRSVGQPDAPIGRLDDVDGSSDSFCAGKHAEVHVRLDPIIGLDNRNIVSLRL